MKYRVGDKVKIREDLVVGKKYGADDFARGMEQYKGKTATIAAVYGNTYRIDIDDHEDGGLRWHWTDEMLEDIEEITRPRNTIDVGYHLDGYGNRILKNVWYKGVRRDIERMYFSDNVDINQYILPTDAIDWVIPHED